MKWDGDSFIFIYISSCMAYSWNVCEGSHFKNFKNSDHREA